MEPTTIIGDKLFDIAKETGIISAIKNKLVNDLEDSDQKMMQAIDEVAEWLKPRVGKAIQFVEIGKLNAANKLIRKAKEDVALLRDNLQKAMTQLHLLKNEFMKVA